MIFFNLIYFIQRNDAWFWIYSNFAARATKLVRSILKFPQGRGSCPETAGSRFALTMSSNFMNTLPGINPNAHREDYPDENLIRDVIGPCQKSVK